VRERRVAAPTRRKRGCLRGKLRGDNSYWTCIGPPESVQNSSCVQAGRNLLETTNEGERKQRKIAYVVSRPSTNPMSDAQTRY
jgi:hypothetical protein